MAGILAAVVLLILGGWLKNAVSGNLFGVLIGVGAGLFGLFLSRVITLWIELKNPKYKRSVDIEARDERNIILTNRSWARTNAISLYTLCIVTLIFVLLNVELYIILTLSGLVLLNGILFAIFMNHYNKKM
jgi:hypothetical protein